MKLNLKHLRLPRLCIVSKLSEITEVQSLTSYRKLFQFNQIHKQDLIIPMEIRGKMLQDRTK